MKKSDLYILSGPNGSGKSTVAEFLLSNGSISNFVNADIIAQGISVSSQKSSEIQAGKVMLQRIHNAINRNEDIAFESTMAGKMWKGLIERAKIAGYQTTICYVAVLDVETAIQRIFQRVKEGGHFIAEETVRRRFLRSKNLFFNYYQKMVDNWYFFDNSNKKAILIASSEGGALKIYDKVTFKEHQYGR